MTAITPARATEATLIGNDNSAQRVIADALRDHFHQDCELGTCACPPQNTWKDVACEVLDQLGEHFWVVPRVDYDATASVRPRINGSWIHRDAGDSLPEHTRQYAAQLLAAADEADTPKETDQ
jgi:hypothetical protein